MQVRVRLQVQGWVWVWVWVRVRTLLLVVDRDRVRDQERVAWAWERVRVAQLHEASTILRRTMETTTRTTGMAKERACETKWIYSETRLWTSNPRMATWRGAGTLR